MDPHTCNSHLRWLLRHDATVRTLSEKIRADREWVLQKIGCYRCNFPNSTHRDGTIGYYSHAYRRIVICSDRVTYRRDVRNTLIHELIHAYDGGRDWTKERAEEEAVAATRTFCGLIACSEIRASSLGQCAEIYPRFLKRRCARLAGVGAVMQQCGVDADMGHRIVEETFERCFEDRLPLS